MSSETESKPGASENEKWSQRSSIYPSKWTTIDAKLFTGRALLRVREFDQETGEYFDDRTRLQSVLIQGRFKFPMTAQQVQTGQEFKEQVSFPAMTKVLITMLRKVVTDLRMEISQHSGFLTLSSVFRTAQRVNISRRLIEWSLTDEVREDTKLAGGYFAEAERDWNQRRKFCGTSSNLNSIEYSPEYYYTFEFFNSFVDLSSFELIVSRWRINLKNYLHDQPIRLLARLVPNPDQPWEDFKDEDVLWSFTIYPRPS